MRKKDSQLIQFGNHVRELRESKGLSQEALADLGEIHRTYLGGIERGERNPTLLSLLKLARALEISLTELLKGF
jgi:transcriptional regulator with XRE-family HTH domain